LHQQEQRQQVPMQQQEPKLQKSQLELMRQPEQQQQGPVQEQGLQVFDRKRPKKEPAAKRQKRYVSFEFP
jgi:hypothetical protein